MVYDAAMPKQSSERKRNPGGWTSTMASLCGLAAPGCAIGGATLASMGILAPFVGFRLFSVAVPVSALGSLVALFALFRARGGRNKRARRKGLFGLTFCVITLAAIVGLALPNASYPLINDISTDLENPPVFVKAATLEANLGRDMTYPPAFVQEQRRGYPTLGPLTLRMPPAEAYERALQTLRSLPNTRITDANPIDGRIEAVSVSRVFHFVDDIVVRVQPIKSGSRIDVRSKSRDGRGDLGANANRIESFFAILH